MFVKIRKLLKRCSLDGNEISFLEIGTQAPRNAEPCVIVQMPMDYFYLCLFSMAVSHVYADKKLLGLWPLNVMPSPRDERFKLFRIQIRQALNWIDFSKWKKLYRYMRVDEHFSLEAGLLTAVRNWWIAHQLWRGLQTKEDVLGLVLNGTPCGDLIYDTYLRFRVQASVDVKDPYLRTVIAHALDAQSSLRKLLTEQNVGVLLTSYSSYVQHGVPVREALRAGVRVYAAGNPSQYFKELSLNDLLHTAAHWRYKTQFEILADPEAAREAAREQLDSRFSGAIDRATVYMKTSSYAANDIGMPDGVEAVVFLHDFFDSPHCYRSMLFTDFWEWITFTLRVIESERLPIAVKPHPNQLPESGVVVEQLKKLFPSVQWINPQTSNLTIFQSGIRCGISVYGTILHELAYHGIPALAAGDHPHIAFDIAKTPETVEEYRRCLINFRSISLSANVHDEVLAFYYMHNIYDKEDLPIDFGNMNLRSLEQSNSITLPRFTAMLKDTPGARRTCRDAESAK